MSQPDHSNHDGLAFLCTSEDQWRSVTKNADAKGTPYELGQWRNLFFGEYQDSVLLEGVLWIRNLIVVMSPENPNAR